MQAKKALVLVLVALAASAFLLPIMVSAASWSSPFALASGGSKPAVALDASGNQHYVWWTNSGAIQYSKCSGQGGNGCSAPVNLPTSGASYYPGIAIDPQGRPNVVFESKVSDGANYAVFWTRKEGGNWTSAKRVSTEPYAELPDIAIGPGGKIHIIYQSKQDTTGYVYYTSSNGGFEFSAPETLESSNSDAPLAEFLPLAEQGNAPEMAEGSQLANGLYPRIAADENDNAHAVWNLPSPYGIKYRFQTNGNWGNAKLAGSGQKDQTPDITVAPNGSVGIIWGTYDDFNAAFAEYSNGNKTNSVTDIDGGLEQSLWPKIAADCNGDFHFVFQGSATANSAWNIYHRSYDPDTDNLGARETVASIGASEQTPAVATTNIAAIVYTNTTNGIVDASTADLGITCSGASPTATHTPTQTNTPDPGVTPTVTHTPTNTPPPTATVDPGDIVTIANGQKCTTTDPAEQNCVRYRKNWRQRPNGNGTDGNFQRCEKDGVCQKSSAAKIVVPDGYTQVKWFTAKAKNYGIANIWINDVFVGKVDLCKGAKGDKPKFVNFTYTIPARNDGNPRTFEIGAPGKHSACSPYNTNFVAIDGFQITP